MPRRLRYGASAAAAAKPSSELSWSRYVTSGVLMRLGGSAAHACSSLLAPERRLGPKLELQQQQRPRRDLVDGAGRIVVLGGLRSLGKKSVEHERPAGERVLVAGRGQR